jgi:hypothetical protein
MFLDSFKCLNVAVSVVVVVVAVVDVKKQKE